MRDRWSSLLVAFAIAGIGCGGVDAHVGEETVRGITVSTHRVGLEWADDRIVPTLAELAGLGANWVAIHPYAGISEDGTVRERWGSGGELPPHVTRPVAEARELGLRTFVKPHLAYWGTPFRWRGEIRFEEEARWGRFFGDYTEWITRMARASAGAGLFAVATELEATAHRPEWADVIEAVRDAAPGLRLTWAANWADYRDVPWWRQLDAVGIQAYFPLVAGVDGEDLAMQVPDAAIQAAWGRLRAELCAFADSLGRPIVFTELGYNRSWRAASEPWDYRVDGPGAEAFQARLLALALAEMERADCIEGAFLWKWFPVPEQVGRDFQLATPVLREVITRHWAPGD